MTTWTSPTTRNAGHMVTVAEWNQLVGSGGNFDHLFDGTYIRTGLARLANYTEGTLSPDEKPSGLGANDTGLIFRSTDYDRLYRWNGSAWADYPGQVPRGAVRFFDTITPSAGWQVCNGSAVTRSTSSGFTTALTVPDYTSAAYVKAIASGHTVGPTAAGGVTDSQGAHTHTVDSHTHTAGTLATGAPSAANDRLADGVSVGSSGHTHNITGNTGGTANLGTDSQGSHAHGPGTLELRRSELLAYIRT